MRDSLHAASKTSSTRLTTHRHGVSISYATGSTPSGQCGGPGARWEQTCPAGSSHQAVPSGRTSTAAHRGGFDIVVIADEPTLPLLRAGGRTADSGCPDRPH